MTSSEQPSTDRGTAIEAALRELVALKEYKDKYGKDLVYQRDQPAAWEAAVVALAMPKQPAEPRADLSGLRDLLCNVAQILDGWKLTDLPSWTTWDQSIRDELTKQQAGLEAALASLSAAQRVTSADLAKTVDARCSPETKSGSEL